MYRTVKPKEASCVPELLRLESLHIELFGLEGLRSGLYRLAGPCIVQFSQSRFRTGLFSPRRAMYRTV